MSIVVRCPNAACGKTLSVADGPHGQSLRCPHCHALFTTAPPASRTSAGESAPQLRANLAHSAITNSRPVPPPASRSVGGAPRRIGRFEVRQELGSGAFGTVYRAFDPQLDREVALKVPHLATLSSPCARQRFLGEAKAAARLRHPNIVPIYEVGGEGDRPFICAAFIDGQTLQEVLEGGLPQPQWAAQLTRDLALALAYAHTEGVVHRDIKPANVLLDRRGIPHLADFGLAHRQDAPTGVTQLGAVLGTPAYMPPEQAAGKYGEPLPASDQYSLGVVLYEMLTGGPPFVGPPALLLSLARAAAPEPPCVRNPRTPKALQAVCLKCLAKKPEERYSSCRELADDLDRWLAGEPVSVLPAAQVASPAMADAAQPEGERPPMRSGGRGGVVRREPPPVRALVGSKTVPDAESPFKGLEEGDGSGEVNPEKRRHAQRWRAIMAAVFAGTLVLVALLGLRRNPDKELPQNPPDRPVEAKAPLPREFWLHLHGFFQQVDADTWLEEAPNGATFRFRENGKTPDYVELQEVGDRWRVRLRAGRCEVAAPPAFDVYQARYWGDWIQDPNIFAADHANLGRSSLDYFRRRTTFQKLSVVGTPLPDEALEVFAGLANLRELRIGEDQFSSKALEQFQARRGDVKIEQVSRERVAAEAVLSLTPVGRKEGPAGVEARTQTGKEVRVIARDKLPAEPFQVIRLTMPQFVPVASWRLRALRNLPELVELVFWVNEITDAGLQNLDRLPRLETVHLCYGCISAVGVRHLGRFENLRTFNLHGACDDATLEGMPALKELRNLHIGRSQISAAGIRHLKGLPKLENLEIYDTQIGDEAIPALAALKSKSFRRVNVVRTKLTPAGLERLNNMLPDCEIASKE